MSQIFDFLRNTYVARTPHMVDAGMRVTDVRRARGSMSLPGRAEWMGDPVRGVMHPGVLTVLADSACGLAAGAALDEDLTYATLDLRMDYLRPAVPDREVHCDAHCFRLTASVAFMRAEVWQDDSAQPIAVALSAFMLGTPRGTKPAAPPAPGGPAIAPEAAARAVKAAPEPVAAPWQPPAASEPPLPGREIPYLEYLGVRVAPDPVQPVFRMPFQPKLIGNPYLPALHGGTVAGFAETAAILHLNQTLAGSKLPKTIDFSIDYLRAARPEETFAQCEVVRVGARVALVTVRCWQRSPDYPVVVARAHFLLAPPQ